MFDVLKFNNFMTPKWCLRVKLDLLSIIHDRLFRFNKKELAPPDFILKMEDITFLKNILKIKFMFTVGYIKWRVVMFSYFLFNLVFFIWTITKTKLSKTFSFWVGSTFLYFKSVMHFLWNSRIFSFIFVF